MNDDTQSIIDTRSEQIQAHYMYIAHNAHVYVVQATARVHAITRTLGVDVHRSIYINRSLPPPTSKPNQTSSSKCVPARHVRILIVYQIRYIYIIRRADVMYYTVRVKYMTYTLFVRALVLWGRRTRSRGTKTNTWTTPQQLPQYFLRHTPCRRSSDKSSLIMAFATLSPNHGTENRRNIS